ncbi:MAG: sulfur carrier protein ThiS [Deltaproteobacteria bacterium]|jgi:sulfur carrier protein
MNVVVNGEPVVLEEPCSVEQVVRRVTAATEGVAVAVNGEVVRRAAWATALQPDDEVEILVATAGG